ncbi:unnamed protein product [Ambrosiozyma monospora]|uniref:Unnamed protein product n=1 Tax=Ambrosiozyma monospora TaxID=43982 RepID=A0ACB5U8X7_AMBMO|nr:unnamed protein product [Ambrosiozyma monospora]
MVLLPFLALLATVVLKLLLLIGIGSNNGQQNGATTVSGVSGNSGVEATTSGQVAQSTVTPSSDSSNAGTAVVSPSAIDNQSGQKSSEQTQVSPTTSSPSSTVTSSSASGSISSMNNGADGRESFSTDEFITITNTNDIPSPTGSMVFKPTKVDLTS